MSRETTPASRRSLRAFLANEDGVSVTEYALIGTVMFLFLAVILENFSDGLSSAFSRMASEVGEAS